MADASIKPLATEVEGDIDWASRLGFWSAVLTTLGGIVYFAVLVSTIISGNSDFPPPDPVQIFGGIISLLVCPVLIVMVACVHTAAAPSKKIFSLTGLAFTLLFAISVSINRFSQLGVVHQSQVIGATDGIGWFLAYGDHSIMFGLEILGWGWFLGLALLALAPVFTHGRLEHWLQLLMVLYGLLGLVSAVSFLLGSPLVIIGFFAWGFVLYIISALLAVYFNRLAKSYSGRGSRPE